MSFSSFSFLLFFPIVCIVYYLLQSSRLKILFLLVASYYFYTCWKPEFAILLFINTLVAYLIGLAIQKVNCKKLLLIVGILFHVSILFFYKYFNFASDTVSNLLSVCGIKMSIQHLDLLLPIGISFYTFQIIAYLVDVYRNKVVAERNFINFTLFIALFTKIAQGPIERYENLLVQINKRGGGINI